MTADANADALVHCQQGAYRLIKVRQARGDLAGVARRATGESRSARVAQTQVAPRRAQVASALTDYVDHVAACEECRPRDAEATR